MFVVLKQTGDQVLGAVLGSVTGLMQLQVANPCVSTNLLWNLHKVLFASFLHSGALCPSVASVGVEVLKVLNDPTRGCLELGTSPNPGIDRRNSTRNFERPIRPLACSPACPVEVDGTNTLFIGWQGTQVGGCQH